MNHTRQQLSVQIQRPCLQRSVVMESVVATVVANEILDKFSSDNMEELKEAVARHRAYVKNFLSSIRQ